MLDRLRRRYLAILASVYIYNEHRGYRSLDRVLEAVRARHPDDHGFARAIAKHRADERKHYLMFRAWFERRGEMPYRVDRTCGHIDRFVRIAFGCHIDDLDTATIVAEGGLFARLCRVVMLTEQRGVRQVDALLRSRLVAGDRALVKIFRIVERDEPSHWEPYRDWLDRHDGGRPTVGERIADEWIHASLVLVKLPLLFLSPRLARRTDWHDAEEVDSAAVTRLFPGEGRGSGTRVRQSPGAFEGAGLGPGLRRGTVEDRAYP